MNCRNTLLHVVDIHHRANTGQPCSDLLDPMDVLRVVDCASLRKHPSGEGLRRKVLDCILSSLCQGYAGGTLCQRLQAPILHLDPKSTGQGGHLCHARTAKVVRQSSMGRRRDNWSGTLRDDMVRVHARVPGCQTLVGISLARGHVARIDELMAFFWVLILVCCSIGTMESVLHLTRSFTIDQGVEAGMPLIGHCDPRFRCEARVEAV